MITLDSDISHYEEEIKKSRFIARAARADSPAEALAFLSQVKEPKATHNCWAYRIGDEYRFSDDGEPGGTAGRPILAAIEGQGLDHVMVVVTRYYGGIKLGAGGLVRAYGNTASECMRTAARVEELPHTVIAVFSPFDYIGSLYPVLERLGVTRTGEDYSPEGVTVTVELLSSEVDNLILAIRDATKARAKCSIV